MMKKACRDGNIILLEFLLVQFPNLNPWIPEGRHERTAIQEAGVCLEKTRESVVRTLLALAPLPPPNYRFPWWKCVCLERYRKDPLAVQRELRPKVFSRGTSPLSSFFLSFLKSPDSLLSWRVLCFSSFLFLFFSPSSTFFFLKKIFISTGSEILGLMVLYSDGFLTFKGEAGTEHGTEKIRRFFNLIKKLPLHLQKGVAKGYLGVDKEHNFVSDDLFCFLLEDQRFS